MGGEDAAGIGGGAAGSVGNIKISGGEIIALGGSDAAGIGSGYSSKCGDIEITNDVDKVVATKAGKAPIVSVRDMGVMPLSGPSPSVMQWGWCQRILCCFMQILMKS